MIEDASRGIPIARGIASDRGISIARAIASDRGYVCRVRSWISASV